MTKYTIDWNICGSIEFEAESAAEAQEKFDMLSIQELAEIGALEQSTDPMTDAETRELMRKYGLVGSSGVFSNATGKVVGTD